MQAYLFVQLQLEPRYISKVFVSSRPGCANIEEKLNVPRASPRHIGRIHERTITLGDTALAEKS